ncbi:MAG: class I SAM-dependent methyltransferase [Candidatus Diapherotrites archaeon]
MGTSIHVKPRRKPRITVAEKSTVHHFRQKLPTTIRGYQPIYSMFLKHAMHEGRVCGKLFEVGPLHGRFMNFLCREPCFARNPDFSVSGIESIKLAIDAMPEPAKSRTVHAKVESFAEQPGVKGSADFVVARDLFSSPSVFKHTKPKIFHAISRLVRKGGKVFLEVGEPGTLPNKKEISVEGFQVIDSISQPALYLLVLEKVR